MYNSKLFIPIMMVLLLGTGNCKGDTNTSIENQISKGESHVIGKALTSAYIGYRVVRFNKSHSFTKMDGVVAASLLVDAAIENYEKNKSDIFECRIAKREGKTDDYSESIKVRFTAANAYLEMADGNEHKRIGVNDGYFGIRGESHMLLIDDYAFSWSDFERKVVGTTSFQCNMLSSEEKEKINRVKQEAQEAEARKLIFG